MHGRSLAMHPTRVTLCNEAGVNGCAPKSSVSVLTFGRWANGWRLRRTNDIGLGGFTLFSLSVDADLPNVASARLLAARLQFIRRGVGGHRSAARRINDNKLRDQILRLQVGDQILEVPRFWKSNCV